MPFTPIHMGPGILIKSVMGSAFSLMVFGWTQIVMDIQPLVVLITGEGQLHGVSHTYLGALVMTVVAALTGKYLSQLGLWLLRVESSWHNQIPWKVVWVSALMGSLSHVFLDSIMHSDVEPYYPWSSNNPFWRWISVERLHQFCLYSGLLGAVIFYSIVGWKRYRS
ncbi:hypothetical protein CHH28_12970 [Bacterioplanes sanyensis]|uniref:Hydrolase n=1 Tax=Bacterioplanes sanyensis TaxID=1249553 RepID=A0A222FL74_9GAMM|nr:metal-dependent hydrolase [Bacterioplanes sanyensis]ASP39530.1 hypothetical protein CHH28_12970 [Bacterioplanes sanyensis]